MRYYELGAKEKRELEAIENAIESGKLKSAPDAESMKPRRYFLTC
jgi:hypothetical protein